MARIQPIRSSVLALVVAWLAAASAGTSSVRAATGPPVPTGCRWRAVAFPVMDGAHLYGVSGTSPTDVWAVGAFDFQPALPVIAHWDGTAWSLASPDPSVEGYLFDVAAIGPNDAWTVGIDGSAQHELIEHWDGTQWLAVQAPSPGSMPRLEAVAAVAADDVWAVGNYEGGARLLGLTEHWDGHGWKAVPDQEINAGQSYNDVTVVASDDVWAAGYQINPGGVAYRPLIEHWDGAAWMVSSTPDPPSGISNVLVGASAASGADVWAVGEYGNPEPGRPLVYHWDGSGWHSIKIPHPGGSNYMTGVAAPATGNVWTIGAFFFLKGNGGQFALRFDGSAWARVASPLYVPVDITSVSTTNLWAVGGRVDPQNGQTTPFTEHSNGC